MPSTNRRNVHEKKEMATNFLSVLSEEIEVLQSIYFDDLHVDKDDAGCIKCISMLLRPSTAEDMDKQYVCLTLILTPTGKDVTGKGLLSVLGTDLKEARLGTLMTWNGLGELRIFAEDKKQWSKKEDWLELQGVFKLLQQQNTYPDEEVKVSIKNPRGLSDAELSRLECDLKELAMARKGSPMLYELFEHAKECLTEGNKPKGTCAICLDKFLDADVYMRTECYHYFHNYCLYSYIKHTEIQQAKINTSPVQAKKEQETLCPVCREPIFPDMKSLRDAPEPAANFLPLSPLPVSDVEHLSTMAEMYQRQKAKGGIIDVEAERNKFLLTEGPASPETEEINPADSEDTGIPESDNRQTTVTKTSKTYPEPHRKTKNEQRIDRNYRNNYGRSSRGVAPDYQHPKERQPYQRNYNRDNYGHYSPGGRRGGEHTRDSGGKTEQSRNEHTRNREGSSRYNRDYRQHKYPEREIYRNPAERRRQLDTGNGHRDVSDKPSNQAKKGSDVTDAIEEYKMEKITYARNNNELSDTDESDRQEDYDEEPSARDTVYEVRQDIAKDIIDEDKVCDQTSTNKEQNESVHTPKLEVNSASFHECNEIKFYNSRDAKTNDRPYREQRGWSGKKDRRYADEGTSSKHDYVHESLPTKSKQQPKNEHISGSARTSDRKEHVDRYDDQGVYTKSDVRSSSYGRYNHDGESRHGYSSRTGDSWKKSTRNEYSNTDRQRMRGSSGSQNSYRNRQSEWRTDSRADQRPLHDGGSRGNGSGKIYRGEKLERSHTTTSDSDSISKSLPARKNENSDTKRDIVDHGVRDNNKHDVSEWNKTADIGRIGGRGRGRGRGGFSDNYHRKEFVPSNPRFAKKSTDESRSKTDRQNMDGNSNYARSNVTNPNSHKSEVIVTQLVNDTSKTEATDKLRKDSFVKDVSDSDKYVEVSDRAMRAPPPGFEHTSNKGNSQKSRTVEREHRTDYFSNELLTSSAKYQVVSSSADSTKSDDVRPPPGFKPMSKSKYTKPENDFR